MAAQPAVEYRQLGKSGLRVSVPIIGAMSFGSVEWGKWVIEEDEALKILKAAWDRGINTIDTANIYSNGISEKIIAKFLTENQIPRHQIIIATKCFGLVSATPGTLTFLHPELAQQRDYVNQSGLSRAAIYNAVEASLARLETSYIDLLQIHRFDLSVPAEETMKALHDLVESGKVRYIGASSMRTWQFAYLNEVASRNGWTKFVSMQDEYSLLYREEERDMLAYCKFNGIGVIPYSPLAGGALARPFNSNTVRSDSVKGGPFEKKYGLADETIITRVEEISKKRDWTMAQVALAWINGKDVITSPIVGISSVKRLEESMIGKLKLTEDEAKSLEEPYKPKPVRGHA